MRLDIMAQKVKTKHALNWFFGNICVRKCYDNIDKQRNCYEKMKNIIKGYEDYLITHKMFIKVMRQKHKICDLTEEQFRKRENDFYRL